MGPKKDNKKGGEAYKEIDPADNIRKPVIVEQETSIPPKSVVPDLSGKIANVETLFEEWNAEELANEVWDEPLAPEKTPAIIYPNYLEVVRSVSLKEYYELGEDPPPDPKAKKKDPKKGKDAGAPVEMVELTENETGIPLPLVFKESEKGKDVTEKPEFEGYETLRGFFKYDPETHQPTTPGNPALENAPTQYNKGTEIDHYICCAYRMVRQFAPAIIKSQGDSTESHNNFLWRAIYPKLPNGKPCYNSSGKYCVRLFLAGKWRKVYVNDEIPLREDGIPALSHSSEKLELWPLLLAKAIYTVYSVCGYSELLDDIENPVDIQTTQLMNLMKDTKNAVNTIPVKICYFVSFAIYALTSWIPKTPMSVTSLFLNEKTRSANLLISMAEAGIFKLVHSDVVEDSFDAFETANQLNDGSMQGGASFNNGGNDDNASVGTVSGGIYKTKRRFKEEYMQRLADREKILESIADRDQKVEKIQDGLNLAVKETYFIVVHEPDTDKWRVLPILAISFPTVGNRSMFAVKILVDWSVGAKPSPSPVSIIEEEEKDKEKETSPSKEKATAAEYIGGREQPPLPSPIPVVCEWTTIGELMKGNAYIMVLDTGIKTPYQVSLSKHWTVPKEVEAGDDGKGGKGKGKDAGKDKKKDKKGGDDAPAVPDRNTIVSDSGFLPITFIKVQTRKVIPPSAETTEGEGGEEEGGGGGAGGGEGGEGGESDGTEKTPLTDEEKAAIADQALEFEGFSVDTEGHSKHSVSLFISVSIYGDMVLERTGTGTAEEPAVAGNEGPLAIASSFSSYSPESDEEGGLPDNVNLILQEVRLDTVPPMMFVVNMRKDTYLPIMQTDILVPASKLADYDGQPIVFWVRVFTKASIYVNIAASLDIEIDAGETVWANMGKSVYIKEGDTAITNPNTEQLLFRLPLVQAPLPPEGSSGGVEGGDDKDTEGIEGLDLDGSLCLHMFHVSNPEKMKYVSVKSVSCDHLLSPIVGSLQSDHHTLCPFPSKANSLVATIDPNIIDGALPLEPLHWKVIVLSDKPITEPPKDINEGPVTQRYLGKYYPNNQLAVFRDVYSVDKASFPLGLRFILNDIIKEKEGEVDGGGGDGDAGEEAAGPIALDSLDDLDELSPVQRETSIIPKTCLNMKFYRKSDLQLVAEYYGAGLLQCYSLPLQNFLEDGEVYEAPPPPDPKAKPKAKGKGDETDTVDVVVECCVDEAAMAGHMPQNWKSNYPHQFDDTYVAADPLSSSDGGSILIAERPKAEPKFGWRLDILSGSVTKVSHDISNLVKYTGLKNSWQEPDASRKDRALAALAYYKEKMSRDIFGYDNMNTTVVNAPVEESKEKKSGDRKDVPVTLISSAKMALTGDSKEDDVITARYRLINQLPIVSSLYPENVELLPHLLEDLVKQHNKSAGADNHFGNEEGHFGNGDIISRVGSQLDTQTEEDEVSLSSIDVINAGDVAAEKEISEKRFKEISEKFDDLKKMLRDLVGQRVDYLLEESESNTKAMGDLWQHREAYRENIEDKNKSLKAMMDLAKEAIEKAKAIENPGSVDPKKKGKKK